jgi:hypothetical protein
MVFCRIIILVKIFVALNCRGIILEEPHAFAVVTICSLPLLSAKKGMQAFPASYREDPLRKR